MIVSKQDFGQNICTQLTLRDQENAGPLMITTPAGWSVETARVLEGVDSCSNPGAFQIAGAASGAITWPGVSNFGFPCLLDIDVELLFEQPSPWIPASVTMSVSDLAVAGCKP